MSEEKKPSWWSDNIAASWNKAKATAVYEWQKLNSATTKDKVAALRADIAEKAMAFGHGARVHASAGAAKVTQWTDQLEKELSEEWTRLGHDGEAAWTKVRDTVKAQWNKATNKPQ